ncbi:MAG: ribosome-associated translation inhibitor RaiA [Rhodospirillales bacterium]|nr:ribosome-associated translation inhibitor RaiA [Rhodospirillales bacterium]MCB9996110.1 ribosome-associated translation inhibitor RaiA [Rhodospirillales bacterium]
MQLTVQGKQMDVGDALRTHVTEKLEDLNSKYFNHATFATVTFAKEGHGHGQIRAHIQIRVGKDIMVLSDSQAGDPYGAFDTAAEKVGKQLRRYKKRLRDHHDRMEQTPEAEIIKARDYTLAATPEQDDVKEDSDIPHGEDPVIVAEITTDIQTMSVSDAVMRMDLSGQTALLFRNAKHNGLNMIYRRPDGNIGWIDPEDEAKTA